VPVASGASRRAQASAIEPSHSATTPTVAHRKKDAFGGEPRRRGGRAGGVEERLGVLRQQALGLPDHAEDDGGEEGRARSGEARPRHGWPAASWRGREDEAGEEDPPVAARAADVTARPGEGAQDSVP